MPTFVLLCYLIVFTGSAIAHEHEDQALILEDISIVDVEQQQVLAPRSMLVENGRITAIADTPLPDWPAAQRPSVAGLFLSPALYDAHVHIYDERDLRMYALGGIQVVRNMDGWPWHLAIRDAEGDSHLPQARVITTGSQLQLPDISNADDALQRIREEGAAGFDWIKLYDDLPGAALEGIATEPDLLVTGHLPSNVPLADVLALAVLDDIAHAEELSHALGSAYPEGEEGLDTLARDMQANNTALTTTIVNNRMIADQLADIAANLSRPEVADAPPLLQAFWRSPINPWSADHDAATVEGVDQQVEDLMKLAAGLHQRGVVLLAGTDAPNPSTVPAHSLHQELLLLVEVGLSPGQALSSATVAAADHLEPGHRGARIENGAAANFILSKGNPLQDIGALKNFDALLVDGRLLTREQAECQRLQIRKAYARDLRILSRFAPDSPAGVFEAMDAASDDAMISREGLTSLVWFYIKVGNTDAATAVAERLVQIYPSAQTRSIQQFIESRK